MAPDAAASMRITAQELYGMGLIDEIVPEPVGGAHRNVAGVASEVGRAIRSSLAALDRLSVDELMRQRYSKYRDIRFYAE